MKCQRGFTLIEVLIAAVILAVGLVAVVQAMGRTQEAIRISNNLVLASQILDEKIVQSELELKDRQKLSSMHDSGAEKFPGKRFEWEKEVVPYASEGKNSLNKVQVQVRWKEGLARENERMTAVLFADKGIPEVKS